MGDHQRGDPRRVVLVLLKVRYVLALVREVNEALQRLQLRVQCSEDVLHQRGAVDRVRNCLAYPRSRPEPAPSLPELKVDVLERRTRIRLNSQS